jgi:PAS domain S-box-containing protein
MVVFKDVEGRHLIVNEAAEKFIGLRHEELAGKTNEELLPPGLAVLCRKSDEEAIKSPTPVQYEEPVIGKDGKLFFSIPLKHEFTMMPAI